MTRNKSSARRPARRSNESPRAYPFTQIVGQDEMRLALILNAVAPSIGGVLVTGHRGTGKSTAVRALAEVLPPLERAAGCAFNCDPDRLDELCDSCRAVIAADGRLRRERASVPVVDLPLNATEDRVCGAINLERALREGVRAFEPGLLARAHRGFLYIDEVNLLEDHLVDLLLDVAATARNRVEREGVSAEHAARFVLVGSSNPEEGELRPQLLDRFGLCAEVRTPADAEDRAEVVTRREAFDRDPAAFCDAARGEQERLRRRLVRARRDAQHVEAPRALVHAIAELCARLGVDGHRGELTIARAARALAAFEGRKVATGRDARRVATLALRHRLRRDPFEQPGGGGGQIEKAADEILGDSEPRDRAPRSPARDTAMPDHDERAASSEARHAAPTAAPEGDGGASAATRPAARVDDRTRLDELERARDVRARAAKTAHGRARTSAARGVRGRFFGESSARTLSHALAFDATLRAAAERLTRTNAGRAEASSSDGGARSSEGRERSSESGARGDKGIMRSSDGGARSDAGMTRNDVGVTRSDAGVMRGVELMSRARRNAAFNVGSLVAAEDLRFKLFSRREGALYIFAVDTSGSMAVNRIGQAKGALARLLRRSYVRRDRVALVTFGGARGETLLRPSRSPALARRLLDALPVGGATPLASGLQRAHEIAARARREGAGRVALLVFTDGRANVPAAQNGDEDRATLRRRIAREIETVCASLRRAGVESAVIDTRSGFASDAEGKRLARTLGGSYTRLPRAAHE